MEAMSRRRGASKQTWPRKMTESPSVHLRPGSAFAVAAPARAGRRAEGRARRKHGAARRRRRRCRGGPRGTRARVCGVGPAGDRSSARGPTDPSALRTVITRISIIAARIRLSFGFETKNENIWERAGERAGVFHYKPAAVSPSSSFSTPSRSPRWRWRTRTWPPPSPPRSPRSPSPWSPW